MVVTFDLWNRLIDRPVEQGQALLRVAKIEGPWQLELHMPENRMGHVAEATAEAYEQSREKLRELLRETVARQVAAAPDEERVDHGGGEGDWPKSPTNSSTTRSRSLTAAGSDDQLDGDGRGSDGRKASRNGSTPQLHDGQ